MGSASLRQCERAIIQLTSGEKVLTPRSYSFLLERCDWLVRGGGRGGGCVWVDSRGRCDEPDETMGYGTTDSGMSIQVPYKDGSSMRQRHSPCHKHVGVRGRTVLVLVMVLAVFDGDMLCSVGSTVKAWRVRVVIFDTSSQKIIRHPPVAARIPFVASSVSVVQGSAKTLLG